MFLTQSTPVRRRWIEALVILCMMIPLGYALPLVSGGLNDLHAVRHLDEGEFTIFNAWQDTYAHGPFYAGAFDRLHIYPKAFYNVAGIILYPYTAIAGIDFRLILIVWRLFNALCGAAAVGCLFLLIRRLFRSDVIGCLAAGLFAIVPEFLNWTANVRPNPFEQCLIFLCLYVCVLMCERFTYRRFLIASCLGAVAFAAKYGGWPFLVLVPFTAVCAVRTSSPEQPLLDDILRRHLRQFATVAPVLIILCMITGSATIVLFQGAQWDGATLFLSLSASAFPADLLLKVAAVVTQHRALIQSVICIGITLLWLLAGLLFGIWRWSHRWLAGMNAWSTGWKALALFSLLSIQTFGLYCVIFFCLGPAYLAHPSHLFSQVAYLVYYSGLAGSYGGNPPTLWEGLQITANLFPGWWLFLSLLVWSIWRYVRTMPIDATTKIALWTVMLYIVVTTIIFFTTRVVVLRHVLPTLAVLNGLIAWSVVHSVRRTSKSWISMCAMVMLLSYVGISATVSFRHWEDKRDRSADIGLHVGQWIRVHYPSSTRIITELWTFYTPPEFSHVTSMSFAEWRGRSVAERTREVEQQLVDFEPELIVIAEDKYHPKTIPVYRLLSEHDYHVVKEFSSHRRGDRFASVRLFERRSMGMATQ